MKKLIAVLMCLASGWAGAQVNQGPMGALVQQFGGLQFALDQATLGAPAGTMSGYVAGDSVTLQCTGVTFTVAPVIGIGTVTAGAATSAILAIPGQTSGFVPSGAATCSQASTSGSGTGLTITGSFGLIAAYIRPASLSVGGAANNQNFMMNQGINDGTPVAGYITGGENVFIGAKAGYGLGGIAQYNTAIGASSCGPYGTGATGVNGSNMTCIGTDSGRNVQGTAYNLTAVGAGAGRNVAGQNNTFVGANAGGNGTNTPGAITGQNMTIVGSQSCPQATGNNMTCYGYNVFPNATTASIAIGIGRGVGPTLTTGGNIVAIGPNQNCDVSSATVNNEIDLCAGSTYVFRATGAGTPSTSASFVAGTLGTGAFTIATLPTCNSGIAGATAYVTNGQASPTYLGAVSTTGTVTAPVFCNGSGWVYH